MEGKAAQAAAAAGGGGQGGQHVGTAGSAQGRPLTGTNNNMPPGSDNHLMFNNNLNGLNHSDNSDNDDDHDDEDDNSGPDSKSLGSTSEQSLTSPAGFSSIHSLGSPASIASPSTPSQFEAAVSQADLFRHSSYGAFKPPSGPHLNPAVSSSSNSTFNPQNHILPPPGHPGQHHPHAMFGLHHRPPVGTDPRDSKNPLSISQLTGNFCSAAGAPNVGQYSLNHHNIPGGPTGPPNVPDKRALPLMT